MLNVKKVVDNDKAVFTLEGRLDTVTAPDLEAEVNESISGLTDLVFDCADLEYISSAGLRVLLSAQKVMMKQGEMKLINVNEIVMEILDVTGFSDIITVE